MEKWRVETRIESYSVYDTFPRWAKITMNTIIVLLFLASFSLLITTF